MSLCKLIGVFPDIRSLRYVYPVNSLRLSGHFAAFIRLIRYVFPVNSLRLFGHSATFIRLIRYVYPVTSLRCVPGFHFSFLISHFFKNALDEGRDYFLYCYCYNLSVRRRAGCGGTLVTITLTPYLKKIP